MVKTCAVCGSVFERRLDERPAVFKRRKRCGFYCRPVTRPDRAGRARARRMYEIGPCEVCGAMPSGRGTVDRHHRDSNRLNNDPANIAFLCRVHHMAAHRVSDGRVGGGRRDRVAGLMRQRAVEMASAAASQLRQGTSVDDIAGRYQVHRSTVLRWFRKYPEVLG